MLGRDIVGQGAARVMVLHDWMGDRRNYEPMIPYLDQDAFTYAFADLRGYGKSAALQGRYDLEEGAQDVLSLATHLGWEEFHLVGHSMSSLVAQQVAVFAPERVQRLVLLCPISPAGLGTPPEILASLQALARDEARRPKAMPLLLGPRWAKPFIDFKLARWAESADPEACAGYARMYATSAVAGKLPQDLPVLAVVGEYDAAHFQEAAVRAGLSPHYAQLELAVFGNSGHYPMQETPVALASALETFLQT